MAEEKVAGLMATGIGLNVNNAVEPLGKLKSAVKDANNEWKQMESQAKQSGDTVGATKARFEGLTDTVSKQEQVLAKLKQEQSEVNRSTEAGEQTYQKYANQITQAESKLASLNTQTEKARKAYEYQESGLAKLNDEIKHSNDLTDARVKRLEAEGKTEEANKTKVDALTSVQDKYTKILEIQKNELEKLGDSGDKNSKAYKLQELRVEQTGAKIAETTSKIKTLNNTDVKPNVSGVGKAKSQLENLNDVLASTHSRFKDVLMGNIVANGITNTLSDIKSKFTGALKAGVEYNKEMQSLSVSMDNFTNGDDKLSKALIGNVKSLKEESGYATDTVSLLTKKTYGLTKSVDGAKQLSDAFVNLGRATGQSDESLQGIIKKFSQVNASGQITTGSLTKMEKSLPGFNAALATSMGKSRDEISKLASDGKLSMADLSKAIETMSDAKPYALDNYYTTLDGFSSHLEEKYKSLSGKITSGFFQSNNDFLKNMSKSLDGEEVENAFNHIGDSANKAVNTVVDAFSKTFKGTKNPIADIANSTADQIEKLGNFVATHSKDIENFFKMVKDIGGAGFKLIGDTLKVTLPILEKVGDFASKHPKDVKLLAETYLGLTLALKGTLGTLKGIEKAKSFGAFTKGLFLKVDTETGEKQLTKLGTLASKIGGGIKNSLKATAKVITTGATKSFGLLKKAGLATGRGLGKALSATARVATTGATKSFELLKKGASATGSSIAKMFKSSETAKIVTKGATKSFDVLKKGAQSTGTFVKSKLSAVASVATKGATKSLNIFQKLASTAKNGITKAVSFTAKIATNVASKTYSVFKKSLQASGKAIVKSLKFTASIATKGATKAFSLLKSGAKLADKAVAKSLSFTAKVATKAATKSFALLKAGAKGVASGFVSLTAKIKAFSLAQAAATVKTKALAAATKLQAAAQKIMNLSMKANPFGIAVVAITALIAGFVALYKHSKAFREFVNGLAKAAREFAKQIIKIFANIWDSLSDSFGKYVDYTKKIVKAFTDFFTGKWGNLGKDLKDIWNSLWNYLESIFGKKIDSLRKGIEDFAGKIGDIFNGIKKTVSDIWSSLWDGMKNIVKDGLNVVISIINAGIGGINSVVHTFGGKENAIGKIDKIKKFANGTKGAPKGLAVVNDAPGVDYQEAIIDNSGEAHVLEGRNRLVNFSGGETVIPAHAMPKFAKGTDDWLGAVGNWFKDKWDGLVEFVKHPLDSLSKVMTKAVTGMIGGQTALVTQLAPAMGNGLVGGIVDPIKRMFEALKKKHDSDGGGGKGAPSGSGVNRWRDQVVEALKANGLSTNDDMVNKVLRQIATESGGNEKAVQGGYTDVNTLSGDLAKGLMQTISATFNAYKFPGHGDIFNGYDNLLAALKYAKNRYGNDLSFLGQGHGYEYGGIVSQHGLYEVAEKNMPEMIIPLAADKHNRANQLLSEANYRVNGTTNSADSTSNIDVSEIQAGVNQLVGLVGLLLGVNKEQLMALSKNKGITMPDLYNRMAKDSSMNNFQSI
ncbi:prophage protein, tail component [Weissella oryzae SG25]|uniref:Prophage protein, tail component n=1 Tax=Weissella oryzae (strain DSM 25784 / JCM 18191 / LMG 30913 / SG25) TaxID=1329250 RepID=A0A069CS57_WEIOS|nr:tape measure protein [Weissella oryzae]GAK30222.1 prophage protein, tail component [Weissella oryzae SG25]